MLYYILLIDIFCIEMRIEMKRKIAVIFACVVFAVCLSFSFSVYAAEVESNTDKQTTAYSENQSEKRHINDGTVIELEYTVVLYRQCILS